MSKYSVNISGSNVGAVAVGAGAEAKGKVEIGGPAKPAQNVRLSAIIEARGATSREELASMIEDAAAGIRKGAHNISIGDVSNAKAAGCAGKVTVES